MFLVANVVVFPAKNEYFSANQKLEAFFLHQPDSEWAKTASNVLSERTAGYVYFHHRTLPAPLSIEQLRDLLNGKSHDYDRVLIETDTIAEQLPIREKQIIARLIGERYTKYNTLYLIKVKPLPRGEVD